MIKFKEIKDNNGWAFLLKKCDENGKVLRRKEGNEEFDVSTGIFIDKMDIPHSKELINGIEGIFPKIIKWLNREFINKE